MSTLSQRLAALSPAKRALLQRALKASQDSNQQAGEIVARDRSIDRIPLSFSQQRLWFLDQFDGPSATYNMPIAVRLSGRLDSASLKKTIQSIVDRHEALRTTIHAIDGEPYQKVHDAWPVSLEETDLGELSEEQGRETLAQIMQREATAVFDLAVGPLLRCQLIRLSDLEHVLLMTVHHIVCDGWSIGKVLLGEMVELYDSYANQKQPTLPELKIQYGDYAIWQRNHLAGDVLARHQSYWNEALRDLPALLELPTDRPRPPVQTYRGDVFHFTIDKQQVADLKAFGLARKATLFMTLLAGFSSLLARYARQDDVAVGSPMAGRTQQSLEPLMGFFVNTLVLRTRLSPEITTDQLIDQVRDTCLSAYQHQELPFERLVESLKPERTPSFSPLFQVMFILQNQNQERGGLRVGELLMESMPIDAQTAMFDLTLKLEEQGSELLGEFEYNTDLFNLSTIERFVDQFRYLLGEMVKRPQTALQQLPLMSDEIQKDLLRQTRHPVWAEPTQTLLEPFALQVTANPDRIAVRCGQNTLTYAQLHTRSLALAQKIGHELVGVEHPIGLCLSRGPDMVTAMLAVLISGNAYVPIDPAYPKDRIEGMVEQGKVSLILCDSESVHSLPQTTAELWLSHDWPSKADLLVTLPKVHPQQLAYIIFTSGSTGRPKGVQISHAALLNFLHGMQESPGLTTGETLTAVTTISFDIAGLEIYLPLLVGATIDLVDRQTASDGFLLLEHLQSSNSDVMQATPSTWRMLLATGAKTLPIKRAFCGGEALDAELARQITNAGIELWNLYGPTETTIWSTAGRVHRDEQPDDRKVAPPIGQAIRGTSLYVLDPWLEPSGAGVPGELYIGGIGLSRGYFNQAGLTADRFVPDPFSLNPGGRMYRTGDLVIQRESGRIDYVGRTDFQVKIRGFRIELGEIESVLKSHPAVGHAVAVARAQDDGNAQLVAYVETVEDFKLEPQQGLDVVPGSDSITQKWQAVWDETYESAQSDSDDFSGWLSSYTGEPIGEAAMTAWTDETVDRILSLHPQRILEVGCGTGLLARRLAPHVEHYLGVDFSAEVLSGTRARMAHAGIQNVSFIESAADQIPVDSIADIDTIVINSVAQYFPDASYLVTVLQRLLPRLQPNARIFLGDLRSLPHLAVQHASVLAYKSESSLDAAELRRQIDQAVLAEEELLFDARWFISSAVETLDRTVAASMTLKSGAFDHEMARFRYDLTLFLDQCPANLSAQIDLPHAIIADTDLTMTLDTLASQHPGGFVARGFVNSRTACDAHLIDQLENQHEQRTLSALRTTVDRLHAVDPDQVQAWARIRGWSALTAWDPQNPANQFCVVLQPASQPTAFGVYLNALYQDQELPAQNSLTNQPGRGGLTRQLVTQLRESLEDRLPIYMVPSAIVVLKQLPLTPNGKIDRAALPDPDETSRTQDYLAPRSELEQTLCEIWSEVLSISRIGVLDNFFHLGGHSLLAVQVIAKIRDRCAKSLPIQTLFDAPTIEQLVTRIESFESHAIEDKIKALSSHDRARGPLSYAQRQLWFLEQLQGSSATYHVSAAAQVDGELNLQALKQSFVQIVARHEALRTSFVEENGEPFAVVNETPSLDFEVIDVADQAMVNDEVHAAVVKPFNLSTGNLLRIRVLRLSASSHVMVMVIHHIISDEWSIALLQQELATMYPAYCTNQSISIPELEIQYADYAAWQQLKLRPENLVDSLRYWREHLLDAPPLTELPTDHPRPVVARQVGATTHFRVSAALITSLKELSAKHGVTLFMTLFAGWATLLGRRSNTQDIVIGVPMTDRSRSELEPLIGFFVNTLPVRIDLSGTPSTSTLLKRVGKTVIEAFAHQSVPLDMVIDEVKPLRSLSHTPLFQTVFVMQNAPKADLSFGDLSLRVLPTDAGVSKFDLTLSVEENNGALDAVVEYNTDLFDSSTISALLGQLQSVWQGMCKTPDLPVSALALLDSKASQTVLALPNPSTDSDKDHVDILELLERQVKANPDSVALVADSSSMSYAELAKASNRLSQKLIDLGVKRDSVVGIYADPSLGMVVAMLGIMRAGAAYLPIVPDTPAHRVQTQLSLAKAELVIDVTETQPTWIESDARVLSLRNLLPESDQSTLSETAPSVNIRSNDLACVIFTSGSTGEPKGVQITRGNLAASVWARQHYYREPMSGLLLLQPFSFDVATGNILWTLCSGACLFLEPRQTAFEPERLLHRIVQTRVSHLVLLPLLYSPLLSMATQSELQSLKCVVVGGEQMPTALVEQHQELATNANLYNEYGPTETTVMCAAYPLSAFEQSSGHDRIPIGQSLGSSRLYVLDSLLNPVPIGAEGELCIGGPQVSRGYAQRPTETALRFVPDPFSNKSGARLYRSGDLARICTDGTIELLGRADQQVKIRGFRIELTEVQSALEQIEGIAEAAVIAVARGQSKVLVAYTVCERGQSISESKLREYAAKRLPDYMVPAFFVAMSELPRTRNGKLDIEALPAPESEVTARKELFGSVEEQLARIWASVLGVEEIGRHDNFFMLGGDSILSLQVVSRARQAGLRFSVRQLFEAQTVAELATMVNTESLSMEDHKTLDRVLPGPIQRWFLDHYGESPNHFNQSLMLEVNPNISDDAVEKGLAAIVQCHDMLRARFEKNVAQWSIHWPESNSNDFLFESIDLSLLDGDERQAVLLENANRLQSSLNIHTGPLSCVARFKFGANEPDRLLWIIHHLVVDGVSWRILLQDLESVVTKYDMAGSIDLEPRSHRFATWLDRLHAHAQTTPMKEQASFWRQIAQSPGDMLPFDIAGAFLEHNTSDTTNSVTVTVSEKVSDVILRTLPDRFKATINDILLTALHSAISAWTGQSNVGITLEGHGRQALFDDLDITETVGWFTTTYPVNLKLDVSRPFSERVRDTKHYLQNVPQLGIGFGLLRYLSEDFDLRQYLAGIEHQAIGFNYLGQFRNDDSATFILAEAAEPVGVEHELAGPRPHAIDINGVHADARLRFTWTYSEALHRRETIERVAQAFCKALEDMADESSIDLVNPYTAGDFQLAKLSPADIDQLFALAGTNATRVYPLSPTQQGMLFHSELSRDSGAYVMQFGCQIEAPFSPNIFEQAWQSVMDRHDSLRLMTMTRESGDPLQVILQSVKLPWMSLDWRGKSRDQVEADWQNLLVTDRRRGFDASQAPLMRCALVQIADSQWNFLWTHHHILTDGWCLSILLKEVLQIYDALLSGTPLALHQPPPYENYIAWLLSQDQDAAKQYWTERLAGLEQPTLIGIDQQTNGTPRQKTESNSFRSLTLEVSGSDYQQLSDQMRSAGLTLSLAVQAAWAALLHRYSNQTDVIFGATVSGRPPELSGVEQMVGLFIATVPVRIEVSPSLNVRELLFQLRDDQLQREAYTHLPLPEIQRASGLDHRRELFDSIVVFENYPVDQALSGEANALNVTNVHFAEQTNYAISLTVQATSSLSMMLSWPEGRFDEGAIQQLSQNLVGLLKTLPNMMSHEVGNWTSKTFDVSALAWQHSQLNAGLKLPHFVSVLPTLLEQFEQQVRQRPLAPAITHGSVTLSYEQLSKRSQDLAFALQNAGVGRGDRVAVLLPRNIDLLASLLAVMRIGAAYVPIDPGYPLERIESMLTDCAATIAITDLPVKVTALDPASVTREMSDGTFAIATDPADVAYMIYTSGSTGKPKGVQVTHANLSNFLNAMTKRPGLSNQDKLLAVTTVSFDIAALELYLPLWNGAHIVLADREAALDGSMLRSLLEQYAIDVMQATPTTWRLLLESGWHGETLSRVLCGGEGLAGDLAQKLCALDLTVWNLYGPTETTIWSTAHRVTLDQTTLTHIPIGSQSGNAIDNTSLYIVDAFDNPVPLGMPGELLIGGDGVAVGYFNRPALTAERFVPNAFDDRAGARLYRTGDRVWFDNAGTLHCLGRLDFQVKIRGFRIEPGEVEATIRQYKGVKQCVVSVWEPAVDDHRLVAYVVTDSPDLSMHDLRQWAISQLPAHLLPADWIVLDALPLTPNGKIDRKSLPSPQQQDRQSSLAPRTDTERLVAELYEQVLGLTNVGALDDFFDLGGHSLLAGRLAVRISNQLSVQLPISALFEHSVVSSLAEYLDNLRWAVDQAAGRDENEEEFRL